MAVKLVVATVVVSYCQIMVKVMNTFYTPAMLSTVAPLLAVPATTRITAVSLAKLLSIAKHKAFVKAATLFEI